MTVEELISELENMDPEMEVKFSYNYGDHWRTQVAEDIRSVEEEQVSWSDYHRMDKVLDPEREGQEYEDKEYDKTKDVVLLSASRF